MNVVEAVEVPSRVDGEMGIESVCQVTNQAEVGIESVENAENEGVVEASAECLADLSKDPEMASDNVATEADERLSEGGEPIEVKGTTEAPHSSLDEKATGDNMTFDTQKVDQLHEASDMGGGEYDLRGD